MLLERQRYEQAKRLIFSKSNNRRSGNNERSIQQGIQILEDMITSTTTTASANTPTNTTSITRHKLQYTLAQALTTTTTTATPAPTTTTSQTEQEPQHQQQEDERIERAIHLLEDILVGQTPAATATATTSQITNKIQQKFFAETHFLLAETLKKRRSHQSSRYYYRNRRLRIDNGHQTLTTDNIDDDLTDTNVNDEEVDVNERQPQQQEQERESDHHDPYPTSTTATTSDQNSIIQYHYDQAVRYNNGQNIVFLLKCAKQSVDLPTKFRHYKSILNINKYHLNTNLYFASYYQQYLLEKHQYQQQHQHEQQASSGWSDGGNNNPTVLTNLRLILTSYMACIVRAEFTIHKYGKKVSSSQNQSLQNYYESKQRQCQQHREFILELEHQQQRHQQQQRQHDENESTNIVSTPWSNILNTNNNHSRQKMDHIKAAYIDVIQV